MTSPLGADDALPGTLTLQERTALAAWADDDDPPDGFEDRVIAAYLAERMANGTEDLEDEAAAVSSRTPKDEGRVIRFVGWAAAIAAAAAVMLMVRVLPRASEMVEVADAGGAVELEVVRPGPPADPTCEPADGSLEPSRPEPSREASSMSAPQATLAVLGADAALVLAQHCSPCHDSTDPEAKPEALQIFDLEQSQWWSTMSNDQLEKARTRMHERVEANDDDRRHVDAFVEARLQRSAHAG